MPPTGFSPSVFEVCGCQGAIQCEFGAVRLEPSSCDPQSLDWPEHSVLFGRTSILRHRKNILGYHTAFQLRWEGRGGCVCKVHSIFPLASW